MKKTEPKASVKRTLETFAHINAYEEGRLVLKEPSCFNGIVSFRKTRITIEPIEENADVLYERLIKLWRECDNFHHYDPLCCAAKSIGRELPRNEYGKARKDK